MLKDPVDTYRARHERGRTAGIVKGKAVVSKAVESEIWVSFAVGAHPFSRPINRSRFTDAVPQ